MKILFIIIRENLKKDDIMAKLIFVIGATATGKTYFIEQNFKSKDFDVLNVYDYQQRELNKAGFGEHIPFAVQYRSLMQANQMLLEDIIEKLSKGRNLVVEQTFFKAKRRISFIDEIRKKVDVTIEMYVMQPTESSWKANLKKRKLKGNLIIYKNDANGFEFPNVAEGIDTIYEVVDGNIKLRMDPPRPEILEQAREELAQETECIRLEDDTEKRRKELIDSMNERPFWHYCEVCGKKEYITAKEAYERGWDYPPDIGDFGVFGPRTCGSCLLKDTLYWKITISGIPLVLEKNLTPKELETWRRIKAEPESLLDDEG